MITLPPGACVNLIILHAHKVAELFTLIHERDGHGDFQASTAVPTVEREVMTLEKMLAECASRE